MSRNSVSAALIISASFIVFLSAASKPGPTDLSLSGMKGEKVHLRDLRGKTVVLNFWATWCGPCRHEMPMMVEEEKLWWPRGVVFIGASLDDNKSKKEIPAFLEQFRITFPIWTGASPDDLAKLKLGNAVPDTVFLDPEGVIFARIKGEVRREEIEERLAWVTGDRKGPAPEAVITHLDQ